MSEPSGKPAAKVSMTKRVGGVFGASAVPAAGQPGPPQPVRLAALGLIAAGVLQLVASVALLGYHDWVLKQLVRANRTAKTKLSDSQLHDRVSTVQHSGLIASFVLLLILGLIARAVYRGAYWSRWAVIGVWALMTLTNQFIGLFAVLLIAADAPLAYKVPMFLAGLSLLAAVVLVVLRPSVAYFSAGRPVRAGAPVRRGLFGPRPSPALRTRTAAAAATVPGASDASDAAEAATTSGRASATAPGATTEASAGSKSSTARPDGPRAKARADDAAVARGADLARTRAKAASKSRRRADA